MSHSGFVSSYSIEIIRCMKVDHYDSPLLDRITDAGASR